MKKNLLFKGIALLAAILLSQAVNSAGNSSVMTISSQIELKNLPDDRVVMKPKRPEVKVTIKGPSFLVGPVAAEPPPFRVRVPDGIGERVRIRFTRQEIGLPPSVELLAVEPAEMEFELEAIESKELRVDVPRIGHLARNIVLDGVVVTPPTITVRGPQSEIRALRSVEVQPLLLSEIESTEPLRLELDVRPPPGRVTLSEKRVSVSVQLSELETQKEFTGRPVEIRTSPDVGAVKIDPTLVKVVLSGPGNVLSTLNATEVVPYVRLQVAPDVKGSDLTVRVDPPQKVTVLRIDPPTVKAWRTETKGSGASSSKQSKGSGAR